MSVVLWILTVAVLLLSGGAVTGISGIFGKKRISCKDNRFFADEIILTGACVVILIAFAAQLCGVFFSVSLKRMSILWAVVLGVFCICGAVLWIVRGRHVLRSGNDVKREIAAKAQVSVSCRILTAVLVISVALQIVVVMTGSMISTQNDITLETVRSFIAADGVYQVNPLTGEAYTAGIPTRIQILCLPGLYAIISDLTHLDAMYIVYKFIPVVVLLGSYLAYISLGRVLFGKDLSARVLMLILVSLLYWFGDYLPQMDGFLLLHCGWRGVALRAGILIPFTVSMCLRRKWFMAVVAIAVEAAVVWTLYGLGACLIVMLLIFAVQFCTGCLKSRKEVRNV